MPGTAPPVPTEHDALRAYLRQQHDGIRYAAFGLTDEQAHTAPTVSAITIAGLVKHVTTTERAWMARVDAAPDAPAPESQKVGSPWVATGETLEDLLAAFTQVADATEAAIPGLDLDTPVPVPSSPWFPKDLDAWSVRWVLFHLIEEVARHAGHGDIIREHLDGATMYELMAGAEGWPQTRWLKPWKPTP